MGSLEIILLVMGVVLFIAGYVFPEKKEKLNEDQQRMVKDEVVRLTGEEMATAKKELGEAVEESVNYAVERSERSLERISNEKVMAVSEYADSVLSDIQKNHDEVVFMYDVLSGKHNDLKETVKAVDKTSKEAREVALDAKATAEEVKEVVLEVKEEAAEKTQEEKAQEEKTQEGKDVSPKIVEFKPMPEAARKRGDNSSGLELLRHMSSGDGEEELSSGEELSETAETGATVETGDPAAEAAKGDFLDNSTENAASEDEKTEDLADADESTADGEDTPKRGRGRPKAQKNSTQGEGNVQDISALLLGGGKRPRNMEGKKPTTIVTSTPPKGKLPTSTGSSSGTGIQENSNARILALHEKGKSPVNIARELGLGVGEVQLVIGLYDTRN